MARWMNGRSVHSSSSVNGWKARHISYEHHATEMEDIPHSISSACFTLGVQLVYWLYHEDSMCLLRSLQSYPTSICVPIALGTIATCYVGWEDKTASKNPGSTSSSSFSEIWHCLAILILQQDLIHNF